MKPWQAFLLGQTNPRGLNLRWIFTASNVDLEDRHDWIQWAFPIDTPTQFVDGAPVVTLAEMQALDITQQANIRRCHAQFATFLQSTQHWRRGNNHNHLRITRVLRCLTLAGMDELATQFLAYATENGQPTPETLRYWRDAVTL